MLWTLRNVTLLEYHLTTIDDPLCDSLIIQYMFFSYKYIVQL